MRVLLVTSNNQLAEKLAALNPELEYCGIIVDEVESAKKIESAEEILEQVGLSDVPLYPITELKTCADTLDYDYILFVQDRANDRASLVTLLNYKFITEKVISFAALPSARNWETERHLRYYQEHLQEFEIFATGISYIEAGIDIRKFRRKAINFATSSQDLYYNFQIAKYAVLCGGGIVSFVTLSSAWRLIPSATTSLSHLGTKVVYCLISLLLMMCIISLYRSMFTENFSSKNG